MTLNIIAWYCVGSNESSWFGINDGFFSNIILYVARTDVLEDEYLVSANYKYITSVKCMGLEAAKLKGQDLLNSHAIGQAIH